MRRKNQYFFGTLLKEIDVFAFPRTGSHFLAYCFSGLFDMVSLLPEALRADPEAISRQDELKNEVLYALELREPHVPFQPIWLNPLLGGVHGTPVKTANPLLLLIRDPIAAAYSAWRARDRLRFNLNTPEQLNEHFDKYEAFYDAGMDVLKAAHDTALLVRYECLISNPEALKRIVDFVGVTPKLAPEFVYWLTRFENFVKERDRTFYREGCNTAWTSDEKWRELLERAGTRDFRRFGY